MLNENPAVGWTFVVYLGVMIGVGLLAYRRTKDLSDYILHQFRAGGGREIV